MAISQEFETEVSLVIPLFNAERYIEETLQSVVNQGFEDLEVIIIDDGSSDDSAGRAHGFADCFKMFTYRKQENQGVSAARNHGLSLASGKYIGFLDSDDLLLPGSVERRVRFLESEPYRICGGRTEIIDENGVRLNLSVGRRFPSSYEDLWEVVCQISTLMGHNQVMKAQQFRVGQRFAEDWRFLVDLTAAGDAIGCCGEEPLSCYRWHATSATAKEFLVHFNSCIDLTSNLVLKGNEAGSATQLPDHIDPVDGSKVRKSIYARIQSTCLHFAVRDDEAALDPRVVALMDSVGEGFPKNIPSARFENTLTRAFLLPRHSDELHKMISDRADLAMRKLSALGRTPANKAFKTSFARYVEEINEDLQHQGYKVKGRGRFGWLKWGNRD